MINWKYEVWYKGGVISLAETREKAEEAVRTLMEVYIPWSDEQDYEIVEK